MRELYPDQFDEEGICNFKFSNGWRFNQMARENFAYRKTRTKKRKNLSSEVTRADLTEFFLKTRIFQLRASNIKPVSVFNRDQVPMTLAASYAKTIDDKNRDVIQDATFDANDTKRFCTLNLTIPMELDKDQRNLVRSHLVFKATKFIRGEDQIWKNPHGTLERDLWDKRVDVSFHPNAWVDTETNLYGLDKAKRIFERYDECVQFEDNLSSHKTAAVNEFWKSSNCIQKLYPPDLTHVIQPVDRHIGIRYKTEVYKAMRAKIVELINENKGESLPRIKPLQKRVLITKIVADTHERLARSGSFRRAFLATGT